MKKISTLLIALVLVCSSVFATLSFTVGSGLGLNAKLDKSGYYEIGPTGFVGADIELSNGLSFYNDVELNYITRTKQHKEVTNQPVFYDRTGIGYTFNLEKLSIMFGLGPEVKISESNGKAAYNFGVDTKIKTTLFYTDNCGVTFQITPAFEFTKGAFFSTQAVVGLTFKN